MSVLFAKNVTNAHLEDSENEEDILSQFNITSRPETTVNHAAPTSVPPPQDRTGSGSKNCPLRLRAKSSTNMSIDSNSQTPYGIPIYDLLATVKKRKASEETPMPEHRSQRKKARIQEGELLCEKYRPQQFFDLVGNDDANRITLRWLSRWRAVVFGTEPELSEYTDAHGRPLKKVLLLNGPPGSGKTSAAHAIAKQAGYDVLEINASDERNAAVVNERITSAVQSHQAYSKRPLCIVADEVEGASEHGFVRALVNLLKEDQQALLNAEHSNQHSRRRRKYKLLRRPIIAVCNDVWAPNLHALRQHAEIVHFQRHTPGRLLKRLEAITKDEGLVLPTRALSRIADSCDYDMRACLNAIQFGAQYSFDEDRENFELTDWSALAKMQFQAQKPASFQQLESCSDLDKLIASCFTAYPNCNYIDDMMGKPAALGDFLELADHRGTNDEIKAMVAHAFGQFFRSPRLSASKEKVPLLGGRAFAKPPSNYETVKQTKSIVELAMKQSGPLVRRSFCRFTALTELFPYAIKLACPQTSVSSKTDEKPRLVSLAASLKELGLGLKTEKQENGSLTHKLDPPIELAVIFDEAARDLASSWKFMPRSQLHNGFNELRRRDDMSNASASINDRDNVPRAVPSATRESSKPPTKVRPSGFFGNEVTVSATQAERTADRKARKVWVQYSEGFSNAVRKPISWSELFHS